MIVMNPYIQISLVVGGVGWLTYIYWFRGQQKKNPVKAMRNGNLICCNNKVSQKGF